MKLKDGFVTYDDDGEQIMIAVGSAHFHGLVRSNEAAAFIVNCLKRETDREAIVQAMLERYDASAEKIGADVDTVLRKLRSIGALNA